MPNREDRIVTTQSPGNSSQKALWFIESHFADALTLDDIAGIAGVSRFQMSRAFVAATGLPITRYLRARRLSEAARALAQGETDILSVALEAGYGSHEAFTRAFREQFGSTPEAVRAQGNLQDIALMEPISMDHTFTEIEAPRFENSQPLLIAGLGQRYDVETSAGIPAQWQRFMPWLETRIPAQLGKVAYGVACNFDDTGNFEYICGVEVSSFSGLPADWSRLRIPEQRYAVFTHRDHVSTIRRTLNTIWNKWLPEAGLEAADAPCIERYDENFDSRTGTGGLEIWVAVKD
ncbi:AraC family transcriptional regulator [Uliginosibacterium sp. H3]|uniref:AraC family transcriptional regulator n=1 Tax=Uliginosibacterium silvisoli TaxID=3114758 RepID=A0ABU6K876_9RHOO|nr:AraC family transcriptional regulator [Uliginosibacterium sp. H3]